MKMASMTSIRVPRTHIVIGCFALLALGMSARIVYLHLFDRTFLQDQGDARTIRIERINAHRGTIRDRMGKPLAVSAPVISLWANPKVLNRQKGLDKLARMFGVTPEQFRARLERNQDKEFIYLRRHMPPPAAQKILALKIKGVYEHRTYQRYYPAGDIAAHLVGYTDIDGNGAEGVELSYNNWLKGTPGKRKVLENLYGDVVEDIKPIVEAKPGRPLVLSIDLRLQYLAYRELKSAVAYYRARSGSLVMLDVRTGEVLAMATQPSFNPNNRTHLNLADVRNRAVTDTFAPGSTAKPFTVAVAFATGRYTPQSTINTSPGFIHLDGYTIPDPTNYGVLTIADILAKSSQVGISKLALTLNPNAVWRMFRSVGFGQATGIGLPGERSGELPDHERWAAIERANFAYGYGCTVTPLQLAAAYLVIADGGVKKNVTILDEPKRAGRRVMSRKIARELRNMLQGVVLHGTAPAAQIEGYTVAGKTGTVRRLGPHGYEDNSHLAFFAGMVPATHPRLVTVVMIDDPKGQYYGGGEVAAPVFSKVMAGAVRILNIPPDNLGEAS